MEEYIVILTRLLGAVVAGAIIGLERSYHGRPAGMRTHTLVCVSSSLLMLLTVYQWELLAGMPIDTIRVDPTRMAQGIMTGIGFLGAGVIMKEKLTIRGLTTAASIWITASIGIIIGMGFYVSAVAATVITILVLSVMGWIERRLKSRRYASLMVRYKRSVGLPRAELYEIIRANNLKFYSPSYHLEDEGTIFQYTMTINTQDPDNFHALAEALSTKEQIVEYSIIPTGD
ncbi:MAG: MgtC/SapB family protein [Gammaproteobacteria bacterium]|nr:MgtC/SapB family protein [Gammaproteobacteria bacterium]MDH5777706.1 MgtC/SapB family protein [Gammaproteobacteria bacterium]